MRTFVRLALAAAATLTPAAALAAPITFDSSASSTSYFGYSNTTPMSTNLSDYKPGGMNPTYTLLPGTAWSPALDGSTWVSFNANTGPVSSPPYTAPNGYYAYYQDVFLSNVQSYTSGTVSVMADDTVSVYLLNNNGVSKILDAYNGTQFPHCAAGTPNCILPGNAAFSGFVNGDNYIVFVVHQANASYTGLDYTGAVLTPEPGSLMLLSTGLLSGAGAMMRRFRRSR